MLHVYFECNIHTQNTIYICSIPQFVASPPRCYHVRYMTGFTKSELTLLRRLTTPAKIQDYLDRLSFNHELRGPTCRSPRRVMRDRTANCVEGALFAACALRLHGYTPLVVDLTAAPHDYDHVIAVFKQRGRWGAISKTNHAVLRYRDPVYTSIRELAMSYFHEYTDDDGMKTLRSYTNPVNLKRFDRTNWFTREDDLWDVYCHLFDVPHLPIMDRAQSSRLRRATAFERRVISVVEWKKR
jgi:hypothetical protein